MMDFDAVQRLHEVMFCKVDHGTRSAVEGRLVATW